MEEKKNINDELDFKDLIQILWSKKFLIIISSIGLGFLTYIYSLTLDDMFSSESTFVIEGQSENNYSSISGIGSLVGLDLMPSESNEVTLALELMESRRLFKHLLENETVHKNLININHSSDLLTKNDLENLATLHYSSFKDAFDINHNKASGVIKIKTRHISPEFSLTFLNLILEETDDILREETLQNTSKSIDYLNNQLLSASSIELKQSISQLIKKQLEKEMVTNVSKSYLIKIIDPPFFPLSPSEPSRLLFLALGVIAGMFISIAYVLFRKFYQE